MEVSLHRVLAIPELLDMIFGYLDRKSNVANAQVCKTWSNIALDVLWKDVDNLHRLFGLLCPMKEVGKSNYEFERLPVVDDWKQFEKYSTRVRRLNYSGVPCIRQSALDSIARTRRRLEILPSLHTLEWTALTPSLSVLFMHSTIKHLVIRLVATEHSLRALFTEIIDRMPNLLELDIRSHMPVREIENELLFLLSQLPKLRKITFPRFYSTARIVAALSRLEHLCTIEFQYSEEQGIGDSQDIASFTPTFKEGAFPALYDLSMTTSFDDATRFLKTPFSPNNLSTFFIDSERVIETPESIHQLLAATAEHFPMLKELALVSGRNPTVADLNSADAEAFNITLDILKPVFKMTNLTSLEFGHQYPLALTQEDLEVLASSCPNIESLLLNTEPIFLMKSPLTLEALIPFAKYCTRLKTLGLYVDATNMPEVSPIAPPTPFTCLHRLSVGVSIINEEAAPALYLSQFLAPDCEIECGITWDDRDEPNLILSGIVNDRCDFWNNVNCMVPLLSKLRIQERLRTRAMERELDDLRMRTTVLAESMAMGVRLDLSTCILI